MYLLPVPQVLSMLHGTCTLTYHYTITWDPSAVPHGLSLAKVLQEEIEVQTGMRFALEGVCGRSKEGRVFLSLGCDQKRDAPGWLAAEGYRIVVDAHGVQITGSDERGLFYGVQTFRQMVQQEGAQLPCLVIEDWPAMEARGFYFDASRGRVPTLAALKKLADRMSFYKLNQLQLYVEHSFLFPDFSEMWRDDTPLTAEEILELDAYCRNLHIDLVPSVASFGHLYKLLRTKCCETYCELERPGEAAFSFQDRMLHHTIDVTNPEAFAVIQKMLEEYMQLFSSRYFNICADETFDLGKGKSKTLAEAQGVSSIYTDFVNQLAACITAHGRIPMFWSDIICQDPDAYAKLNPELICLHWDYEPDAVRARLQSLVDANASKLYVCPGVQGWNHLIPDYHAAYENISRMCQYGQEYHALGVLNTDWGDYGHINHPTASLIGMIYGACGSWNPPLPKEEVLNQQISVVAYGDASLQIVSILQQLSTQASYSWQDAVQVREALDQFRDSPESAEKTQRLLARESDTPENLTASCNQKIDQLCDSIYTSLPRVSASIRQELVTYLLLADGQKLLNQLLPIMAAYVFNTNQCSASTRHTLASNLEFWLQHYHNLWITTSKESEFFRIREVICWYADLLRSI